jgi:putative Holliday junction resolvase
MAKDGVPEWHQIEALLKEWKPKLVIVGRPLNMDGSESAMSARAKKFANRIHGRFGVPIALHDERLTSQEAKQMARERGHKGDYSKAPIDALAASLILESYIQAALAPKTD